MAWSEELVLADDGDDLTQVARAINIVVTTLKQGYTEFGFKGLLVRGGGPSPSPDVAAVWEASGSG